MALDPHSDLHAGQIRAGTRGRTRGHAFERALAARIGRLQMPRSTDGRCCHLRRGDPAAELVRYVAAAEGLTCVDGASAVWVGGLATAGTRSLAVGDGRALRRTKSDLVLTLTSGSRTVRVGVSVKTCTTDRPTNPQLYFTTARGFCALLRRDGIDVPLSAERALRMFCGDVGSRPQDDPRASSSRRRGIDRWYWEELPARGRAALERLLDRSRGRIARLLLERAYPSDPFPPRYIIQQRSRGTRSGTPLAIYRTSELARALSRSPFATRAYTVRKGLYKSARPHLAPRVGLIQFQRGGQLQHPTQLQFNLQAGYFDAIAACPDAACTRHGAAAA